MPGQALLLHKPLLSTISPLILQWTHFCMPSQESPYHIPLFLHLIQSCHYLLHLLHQLIPLSVHALHLIRKCFTSSTSPLLHFVHFLSSLFKPLHLQLCCTHLSFISILLIFFLLMITPTLLASNPPLTSYFNTHSLAGSATPLPTSWSLPSTHNSSACTSPPHLTCLSSYPTSHHPIQGLQDIAPSSGSRHFTFPFSDSASLFTSLSFLIVITLCQNSIHLVLYSFPLQREQPHLNLYGCLRM